MGRKHCGKKRNCLSWVISPFFTMFSKDLYSRQEKPGIVWKRVKWSVSVQVLKGLISPVIDSHLSFSTEGYCTTCPDGKYGTSCLKDCDGNCTLSKCNISDGECECTAAKFWSRIHFKCVDCNVGCSGNRCEHGTGHCKCAVGYYGTSCAGRCSANCAGGACNENGMCTVRCIAGYYGVMCNTKCASGCDGGTCSRTGECTGGCMAHYYGDMCDKKCASGCSGQTCSRTGMCTDGCTDGYYGDMCDKKCATGCAECRRDTGECITLLGCKPGQRNCEGMFTLTFYQTIKF